MIVRTLVTIGYLVAVVAAVVLQFFVPALSVILLYALLAWFIASFFVYRLPVMSRPVGGRPAPPAPATWNAGAPLVSNPLGSPLGFCAYCATPVEPGTPVCPTCGHRIPVF